MIQAEKITEIIHQHIEGTDAFLVSATISKANDIKVEVDKPEGITIEECVALSRVIEGSLDREVEDFTLEVASPGIGQPFKILQQYLKNIGRTVEVVKFDGQKLEGELKKAIPEHFTIEITKMIKPEGKKRKVEVAEEVILSYDECKSTRVIIKFK